MGNDGNETPFVPTVPIVSIVSFVPIVSTVPTVRNVPIVLFVPAVRNVPIVLFVPAVRIVPIVPNVPFVPYRKNVPVVSGVPGPLRHSPLARPVPPLPHAGEANVTCRLQPPTFTGEVARRAGEGPRLRDCAAKTGHRNRGPQGRRGLLPAGTRPPRLRGNRPRTKGPVGPFRLHKAKETLLWLTALY